MHDPFIVNVEDQFHGVKIKGTWLYSDYFWVFPLPPPRPATKMFGDLNITELFIELYFMESMDLTFVERWCDEVQETENCLYDVCRNKYM